MEAAEKGLSLLERIQAGGIPLLSMVIAVICGLAFYWQLRRNNKMSEDALAEAKTRETSAETKTKDRLKGQEDLLREMLSRDREAQEAQLAAIQAVEGFTHAIKEQQSSFESMNRTLNELLSQMRDVKTGMRNLEDSVRRLAP